MTNPAPSPFAFVRTFNPAVPRQRHDGWTPARQQAFVAALAESGCVADACRRIGVSRESAYKLRRRYDATDFRLSWDAALDYAVQQLSDSALSRAIHGVPVPHFYKGEQIGEHRKYNESLTMFILRYRDPLRYARHWDRQDVVRGHPEETAERLARGLDNIAAEASAAMHERQNDVLRDAADRVTDDEARRLCDVQLREGVAAAVRLAETMLDAHDRAAAAEAAATTCDGAAAAPAASENDPAGDVFSFDGLSELSTSGGAAGAGAGAAALAEPWNPLDPGICREFPWPHGPDRPAAPPKRGPSVRW